MPRHALLAVLFLAAPASPVEPPPALEFAPVAGLERAEGATALAFDARRDRLAVGDAAGVYVREADGRVRRALGSGPVLDLAFTPEGGLLAATERGLYEIGVDRRVRRHALGPGAAGRPRRIAVSPLGWWVATEGGVHAGTPGGPLRPLDGALPGGEATALAWDASEARLHAILAGDLYAIGLDFGPGGPTVVGVARAPLAGAGGAPLDLTRDPETGAVWLLRERALAVWRDGAWASSPLALPPGVEPLRLASGGGVRWIASDAGLLVPTAEGRFERAAGGVGRAAASAVVAVGARVHAATLRGVYAGAPRRAPIAGAAPSASQLPDFSDEPPVEAVHRVALRYLDLGAGRFASLQERVRRRRLLPELEIGGEYGGFRARDRDQDDVVFSSGDRHLLVDRLAERGRDFEVGASLRWDLSGPVYDPEEIDVSKEVRELIELRDEVLDEINQLYFERRRVLLERARLAEPDGAEGDRLRLRAAELAAGLDAWTGGWWSRQHRADPNPPRPVVPPEDRP